MYILSTISNQLVLLLCGMMLLCSNPINAQTADLAAAKKYVSENNYEPAIAIYSKLYESGQGDVYTDYLKALMSFKKYKDAEKLVNKQIGVSRSPLLYIDMGLVMEAMGKEKKADEQYNAAVQLVNGDDMLTQQMATTFIAIRKDKYAIAVFERAKTLLGNVYLYGIPLAKLYAKTGDIEKALESLLEIGPVQYINSESMQGIMLEILGSDAQKLQLTQKALIKKINEQPDNNYYIELLTWLYTQKNDWDGALMQIVALDERTKADGKRLLEFARYANKERQYDIAQKAYDEIAAVGKEKPYYAIALGEKLSVSFHHLQDDAAFKPEDVSRLEKQYDSFLLAFPQYYATPIANDFATLEAQYAGKPKMGIDILKRAIAQPNAARSFIGECKLQMGDYYVLIEKVWDASLIYSQVDKEFKEDMLGEDARFRNAKLSYYRGDFNWAQGQLTVLKASTSELIANDALYLSVLITENTPPDSNFAPLKRFAYADLLLFQNKDREAEILLDSLSKAYPKHPLTDDMLMLHAKLAEKHREYDRALEYLKQIFGSKEYSKDVLGDDAVFRTAEIYSKYQHDNIQAKEFYEKLILDYPGSTYVQTARKKLQHINSSALP